MTTPTSEAAVSVTKEPEVPVTLTSWVVIDCRWIHEQANPADGVGATYPATSYQDALRVAVALTRAWAAEAEAEAWKAGEVDWREHLPKLEVIARDPNTGCDYVDPNGANNHRSRNVLRVPAEVHGPEEAPPTSFYLFDEEEGHIALVGRRLEPR